jgi:hypothetical protein
MTATTEDNAKVIKQNDPLLAKKPHLDFQWLRRAGLAHIGELSGKIWTDHNAHDPGITILEALCFALIDLGYRTTLPMEDLLAKPANSPAIASDFPEDDNFFTPLEILSCNPTTITDYRKLLLEVDGVRNAWLEPAKRQEVPLWLLKTQVNRQSQYTLSCQQGISKDEVTLNGLYNILIEKEPHADETLVKNKVRSLFSAYRNLCEDLKDVCVLKPLEAGICADVEIERGADAAVIYEKILLAVRAYISPEIRYYTLKQLLDKGKPIEDIFAGRPFLTTSVGFVDTEELDNLTRRKELYTSDLYRIILDIDGVVAIRRLTFQQEGVAPTANSTRLRIPNNQAAVFSLKSTCIDMRSGQGILFVDKDKVHRRLGEGGKSRIDRINLDSPIPQGRFYPEFDEYYSIQHDFPLVYGIGEGGLPEDSAPLRKIQALQLKGYLLFYDQLLANYLSQVGNLRQLFSLKQESRRGPAERHTYFSQTLETVPEVQKLLQVYAANELTAGSVLAVPVVNDAVLARQLQALALNPRGGELRVADSCGATPGAVSHFVDTSAAMRDLRIQQALRDMGQGDFSLEIHEDKGGCFFIFRFAQAPGVALVSYARYRSANEAREAANFATFLATMPQYYRKTVQKGTEDQIEFHYDLVYNPVAYATYLQYLLENEQRYCQRREAFLDHLLARFANQFTDYALLRFGTTALQKTEQQQTIEDKSRFLDHFDDLSRNRGRAYDYLQPAWGAENVSGYEKRIALLAGLTDWKRRRLCKFEVVQRYRLEVLNPFTQEVWFSGLASYATEKELQQAQTLVMEQLRRPENYGSLQRRLRNFSAEAVRRAFSEVPADENIQPSQFVYALALKDSDGAVLRQSEKKDYPDEKAAWTALAKFLKEAQSEGKSAPALTEIGRKSRRYFDKNQIQGQVETLRSYKWHCFDAGGQALQVSDPVFADRTSAIADFVKTGDYNSFITQEKNAVQWSINPQAGLPLISAQAFTSEIEAQRGWLRSKTPGQLAERYTLETDERGNQRIVLHNEQNIALAYAQISADKKTSPEKYIQACCDFFTKKAPKLQYRTLDTGYGWQLTDAKNNVLLSSFALYTDRQAAVADLLDAVDAIPDNNNYYPAGSADNPEYRILLRSSDGRFLAGTPQPYFADEDKRNKALGSVRKSVQQAKSPLLVIEEPRQYRWRIQRSDNEETLLESPHPLGTEGAAQAAMEAQLLQIAAEAPQSFIARQIFTVELTPIPSRYRFVYYRQSAEGKSSPLLKSEQEFELVETAKTAYTTFMRELPRLKLQTGEKTTRISDGKNITVELAEETPENRNSAEQLLTYQQSQYEPAAIRPERLPKWIYRFLDKDHPIAKSTNCYDSKEEAEKNKPSVCSFSPYPLNPKKQVIEIICPKLNPGKFHYAICLHDDLGASFVLLHSYAGYDSREAAQQAATENWLQIIEIAADRNNYGVGKRIAIKEQYSAGADPCNSVSPYIAVVPADFLLSFSQESDGIDKAVALAGRYPIRIAYNKNEKGETIAGIAGYMFYGYDTVVKGPVWQSAQVYPTPQQAIDAYRLFLVVLGNPDGCRIVCVDGKYCIHLIEILAESREFDTEQAAWDEPQRITRDACGNERCDHRGVRLFAETAVSESAFIPVSDGDCYRFMVVDKHYHVARHTCAYATAADRDEAMKRLQQEVEEFDHTIEWVPSPGFPPVYPKGDGYCFRLLYPGNAALLNEKLAICGCEEPKPPAERPAFCGKPFIFESAHCYPCQKAAEEAFAHFIKLLKNPANYLPEAETGFGPYTFSIIDPEKVVATHPHCHPDFIGAMQAAERVRTCLNDEGLHLVEHILLRPEQKSEKGDCNCLLPVCPDEDCKVTWQEDLDENDPCAATDNPPLEYIPGADPYSFWATLVLPGWLPRFNSAEARFFFQEMLYREAPAMVGLNILWLSPWQMCKFERAFRHWLNWKRKPDLLCNKELNPLCDLVGRIKDSRNDIPCSITDVTEKNCNCLPKEKETPDPCLVQSEYLFWLECPPEKPQQTGDEKTEKPDSTAVRQSMNQRKSLYVQAIQDIDNKQVLAAEAYDQTLFFVKTNPQLNEYEKLVDQLLQLGLGSKNSSKFKAMRTLISSATWRLLDQSLQDNPASLPKAVQAKLPGLLKSIQAKGIDLQWLAKEWKGEEPGKLLGAAETVKKYRKLFKEN